MLCEGDFAKLRFLLLPLASARVTRRAISSPRIDAVLPTLCGDESTCMYGAASIYLKQRCCCSGCRTAAGGNDDAVELQSAELGRPPNRPVQEADAPHCKGYNHQALPRIRECSNGHGGFNVAVERGRRLVRTACEAHVLPLSASESRFSCLCPSKSMAMGESISALGCVRPQSNGRDAPRGVQRAQKRGGTLNIARGGLEALLQLSSRRPCLHVAWASTQNGP